MNLVFIVIDTLRADHLGCYGYFRDTSPNIDQLAEKGVLFENYYASGVPTGPGFTSLITGMFPINHEFYITPYNIPNAYQLDDNILTLAEVMWENGYNTAAFDNLVSFRSHMKHFARGYEYQVNVTHTARFLAHHVWAGLVNRRLIPWIVDHRKQPFFLFVHYWDPHMPYNQPEEYRGLFCHKRGDLSDLKIEKAAAGYEYVPGWGKTDQIFEGKRQRWQMPIPEETFAEDCSIDLYDGEIVYVDHCVGQLIRKLKEEDLFDETVIVLTSDHGEQLGQHGLYGHAGLHDANVHLPLIISSPVRKGKGNRVPSLSQHVDVPVTLFSLLEIDIETIIDAMSQHARVFGNPAYSRDIRGFVDGRDLSSSAGGNTVREHIFVETQNLLPRRGEQDRIEVSVLGQRAIRTHNWKLITYSNGKKELYNLRDDPMEVINLINTETSLFDELDSRLRNWVESNLNGREDPIYRPPTWSSGISYHGSLHRDASTDLREIGRRSLDSRELFTA